MCVLVSKIEQTVVHTRETQWVEKLYEGAYILCNFVLYWLLYNFLDVWTLAKDQIKYFIQTPRRRSLISRALFRWIHICSFINIFNPLREGRPKQSRYDHRAQQIAGYILKEVFTIVMLRGQKYIYRKKNWKFKEGIH